MGEKAGTSRPTGITQGILDDLCSRFLVNLPEVERMDPVRVCFQAELAHWFYLDHYCEDESTGCRPTGIREFIRLLFHNVDYLQPFRSRVDEIVDDWRRYKSEVPTYGAALLSPCLRYILLVQGFYAKNSWGFPKGKVNEEEDPCLCAVREVAEEVGLDIAGRISKRRFLESHHPHHTRLYLVPGVPLNSTFQVNEEEDPCLCAVREVAEEVGLDIAGRIISKRRFLESHHPHHTRLYLVPGVPLNSTFQPRTKKEIRRIQWFRVRDLPSSRVDNAAQAISMVPNNFYTVIPFVEELQKWIGRHAAKKGLPDPVLAHRSAFHATQPPRPLFSPIPVPGTVDGDLAPAVLSLFGNSCLEQATILMYEAPPSAPTPSGPIEEKAEKVEKKKRKKRSTNVSQSDSSTGVSKAWANVTLDVDDLLAPWNAIKLST